MNGQPLMKHIIRLMPKPTDDCVMWDGSLSPSGYGQACTMRGGRKVTTLVHRYAFRLARGWTHGKQVLHTCDNRSCFNPKHLFLGTHQQNMEDKMRKGRWKGHTKLTNEQCALARSMVRSGHSQRSVAEFLGVKPTRISQLMQQKRKSEL